MSTGTIGAPPSSHRDAMPPPNPDVDELELRDYRGLVVSAFRPSDPAAEVPRLLNPAAALETLHWRRNYLFRARLQTAAGPLAVVVKQFRNDGLLERWRRRVRGSKAWRSWKMARQMRAAGIPTPEPVLLADARRIDGPSFFVTRHLSDVVEARFFLRAVNAGTAEEQFPQIPIDSFLLTLARTLRRMHDLGFWHRDVSIGNVLIRASDSHLKLYLVDLNRARRRRRLSASQRTRDLCRLRVFDRRHQRLFVEGYWGTERRGLPLKILLYFIYHYGFRWRIDFKQALRRLVLRLRSWIYPRRPYPHLPAAAPGASVRDKIVWDELSHQPYQHASRFEKVRIRLSDVGAHLEQAAAASAAAPRILRRYRQLQKTLHRQEHTWEGLGVCLRPWGQAPEELLAAVEELAVNRILLRLHPWEDNHSAEEALAAELHARGYELAFGLPQNRDLVRDLSRWKAAVEEIGTRFRPYGRQFQIGHAINRSKWGIWNHREYVALATAAGEILRRHPGVEILGPAVIDFELHVSAGVLNLPRTDLHFDVVSSLLYVDRRGAPENRQLGFDILDKVVLLKAIAETARCADDRCWITEVNWPLQEGPHAPAGRGVAVDEQTQANYLARYYLLTLGTGLAERVYWWQLVARGYGLIEPREDGSLRRRPAFRALATLRRHLEGAQLLGPLPAPSGARLYLFRRDGRQLVAAWSVRGRHRVRLPRPATAMVSVDGSEKTGNFGPEVDLGPAPRYFTLREGG